MEKTFLTNIQIRKLRHLKDIYISLSNDDRKHLILTGKNGSGKTSTLEAMVKYLKCVVSDSLMINDDTKQISVNGKDAPKEKAIDIILEFTSSNLMKEKYENGNFILAYYSSEREFQVEDYKNIEKVELQTKYDITEKAGAKLTKYLVDLKATQAFTKNHIKKEKINKWFDSFKEILKMIFEDDTLKLTFNDETFQFSIHQTGREPFDFNTMSSGYAAIFDIINDLIIRMEAQSGLRTNFDMEGIVLIDEIETHLHLELQKKILPTLIKLFPNIQFIVSTHSPFILNSVTNTVIYDLENKTLVQDGLQNLPYEGIIDGYFHVDRLSRELECKFSRYKELISKMELTNEEIEEIDYLEYYLDEIPDYLTKEFTTEYSKLKLEFSNRE